MLPATLMLRTPYRTYPPSLVRSSNIISPMFAGVVRPATKFLIANSSASPWVLDPTHCCEALDQLAVLSRIKMILGAIGVTPGG